MSSTPPPPSPPPSPGPRFRSTYAPSLLPARIGPFPIMSPEKNPRTRVRLSLAVPPPDIAPHSLKPPFMFVREAATGTSMTVPLLVGAATILTSFAPPGAVRPRAIPLGALPPLGILSLFAAPLHHLPVLRHAISSPSHSLQLVEATPGLIPCFGASAST